MNYASRRPLVDMLAAASRARRAAIAEGRDPDECPEVVQLDRMRSNVANVSRRVTDPPTSHGYNPLPDRWSEVVGR